MCFGSCVSFHAAADVMAPGTAPGKLSGLPPAPAGNPQRTIPMRDGCWCGVWFYGLTILPDGADMALHPACALFFRPFTPTRLGTVFPKKRNL